MANKNQNTILWIIGIAIVVIALSQFPTSPWFAIVTETTCAEGVEHYYSLDGNLIDQKGGLDLINNGAIFVTGKIGQALEFEGNNSISFPTLPLNLSVGFWINDYSNTEGWIYKTYDNTSILSSTAFLGLNGSVDEIVITGENISGFQNIQPCYTTSYEENVTCKDYATSQVEDQTEGCLNYSGNIFPNCEYEWLSTSGFYVDGNECKKRFYCSDILTTDFTSSSSCQDSLVIVNETESDETGTTTTTTTPPPTSSTSTTTPTGSIQGKLSEKLFEIAGYEITILHLIIALGVIIGGLYFLGAFEVFKK